MKYALIVLIALFACTKTPNLLENTELPDTAFSWSTVSITPKGVKQSSSINPLVGGASSPSGAILRARRGRHAVAGGVFPQNVAVELPQIRLRFGARLDGGFYKTKAILSVTARAGVTVTGTATITMLDGLTFEPIIKNLETGTIHSYTGNINTNGSVLRTLQTISSTRPCLRITFDVTSSTGSNFKRLSSAPICPDVPPIDLSIKLKTPIPTIYKAPDQIITLRLERPQSLENPLRRERLVVSIPNAENLRTPFRINAQCTTQQNTLTCEGGLGRTGNDPKTMDLQILFDPVNTDPISITASYNSLALEIALANNTTTATLPVLEPPNTDLALTWVAPSQIIAGQTIPVTVNITNLGAATNTARKFTASLGNVIVSSAPNNCGVALGNTNYNCVIPPIPPNGTHTLTWNIKTDYPQTLYLEAVVYGNNVDFDAYGNNQQNITIQVIHDPSTVTELTLNLTANPNPPQLELGQQYTVTITNTSSNPALNTIFLFGSAVGVQFSTTNCNLEFNQCSLGTLAPFESRVITLTSTSTPTQANETISATITTTSPETNPYDNTQYIYATYPSPDLALSLVSNPQSVTQAIGQQHSFTVQNIGTLSDTFNVRIYVSGSADFSVDNPNCSELRPNEFYCWFSSLEPNQSQTVTLTSITLETGSNSSMYAEVNSSSSDSDTSNNQIFAEWQFEP